MTPQRPMLGAVLDALTVSSAVWAPPSFLLGSSVYGVSVDSEGVVIGSMGARVRTAPWRTTDPAEALEILQARDLVPLGWRGLWVCSRCEGTGVPGHLVDTACLDCTDGLTMHPPTVAALVSWASLGWAASDDGAHPGIVGAEEWAREHTGAVEARWRVALFVAETMTTGDMVVPDHALGASGLRWAWASRRPAVVTLTVPPLGGAR